MRKKLTGGRVGFGLIGKTAELLLLYTIIVFLPQGAKAQWTQSSGLTGATSVALSGENLLAGTGSGWVYLSTDSGATWKPIDGIAEWSLLLQIERRKLCQDDEDVASQISWCVLMGGDSVRLQVLTSFHLEPVSLTSILL